MDKKNNLIWIDLEMTGLNPNKNKIIEIATLITDKNLNILSTGPVIAIHQSEITLKYMDKWNIKIHTKSGLINRVKKSLYGERHAEMQTLNFLKKWSLFNTSPMCGNSIHYDRHFLYKYMPKLEKYFYYRHIDVSSIREVISFWKPNILKKFIKKNNHSALQDIKSSIKELLYYRKFFINK
ncbi:Oligoribonuclease [Buchnera aphidicola (Pemphigus populi)]